MIYNNYSYCRREQNKGMYVHTYLVLLQETRAAPILVSVSVSGRYCCFHEVSESAIIYFANTDSLSRARIK